MIVGPADHTFAHLLAVGAQDAARDQQLALTVQHTGWDGPALLAAMREAIAAKPSAICIVGLPGDDLLGPLIVEAEHAGIVVTALNADLPRARLAGQQHGFGYVGNDQALVGRQLAAVSVAHFGLASGARAAVLSTPMAHQGLRGQRPAGVISELRSHGLAVQEYIVDPAITADLDGLNRQLLDDSALRLVISDDPALILPTAKPLSERQVALVCFDIVPEIRAAMARGEIVMAGDQQPYLQGYLPVVQAGLSCRGRFTGMDVDTGLQLVNRALLPDYLRYSAAGLR